jgi:hypothetical protein
MTDDDSRLTAWLAALDARHLSDLTPSEVARALRALSSCYVERRAKLAKGGALDTAGKRAAFALFYGPLHFLVVREIMRALPAPALDHIFDLGCGTGAAGAAWAVTSGAARITGTDRNAWAVAEANRTYEMFGLRGRAGVGDVLRKPPPGASGTGILLAYTVNELPDEARSRLLPALLASARAGSSLLIVEPIARRMSGWWSSWKAAITHAGGRADEWRFPSNLPERQRGLARAAGLDPRELTARTLWLSGKS